MAGDRIVNVDDSLFVGKKLNNELAMRTLKGPKGSQVKLGVKRVGEPKLRDSSHHPRRHPSKYSRRCLYAER